MAVGGGMGSTLETGGWCHYATSPLPFEPLNEMGMLNDDSMTMKVNKMSHTLGRYWKTGESH
jgi:hypothetical protein